MSFVVRDFPRCVHHVFLSHSREDHDALVRPVYDQLVAAGVTPWIDRHHYAYGRDSRAALQSAILECRHVVFFVTPAMLASGRGWCSFELAYAEILQSNLHAPDGPLANLLLPLFFVPQSDPILPRTVWQATRDRGVFHDPARNLDTVAWVVGEVIRFLRREQRRAATLTTRIRRDTELQDTLERVGGLRDRVTRFHPRRLPPEPKAE